MASAELRKPRRISKLSATVGYKGDRSIDTALSDPILPAYGSPRTFGGRNLVVTSIEAEEISPSHCYVYVTYGPPGRMLGGDIEPSEPSFTDKSLDFTSEPLEIPYY